MNRDRLETFSDGVIAVLITVMVLELKAPQGASWGALGPLMPLLLSYVLSFIYLGIYWNNHHHMLQLVERVDGKVLWANLHLLFWLSLIPFVTTWANEEQWAPIPTAAYGVVLLIASFAFILLERTLLPLHGKHSALAEAFGKNRKELASSAMYVTAIPMAFVSRWLAIGLYVAVALTWLVPDRRVEAALPKD